MFVAVFALGLFLGAPVPATAQASGAEVLKGLSGVWKGRGTAQRSSTGAAEPVSCRYEGKLAADGLSLALFYLCLGVEFRFESQGSLTFQPSSDRFELTLIVAGANQRAEGTGVRRGSGIDMTLSGRHPDTGKQVSSRLTMSLSGARKLVNVLRSTDPETGRTYKAFSATFKR